MESCFGSKPSAEVWHHLYFENPSGEPIIVVARYRGRVVSHAALLPRRVRAFGAAAVAGHSIYAMTRRLWQRRGLSRTLAATARRFGAGRGFVAVYGFSNEQSTHGILSYQDRRAVRPFPLMVRPLHPAAAGLALCGVATPTPALDTAGWTRPCFDARHTALFDAAGSLPPIAVVRDAAHLAWRYPAHDGASPYRQRQRGDTRALTALVVVRIATAHRLHVAFIMEWLWGQGEDQEGVALMNETIGAARAAGAHAIAALAMPGTTQRRRLQRLRFIPIPEFLLPQHITLSVVPEIGEPERSRWYVPGSWYLTFGDGDLI